jgi:hypothetical protein
MAEVLCKLLHGVADHIDRRAQQEERITPPNVREKGIGVTLGNGTT